MLRRDFTPLKDGGSAFGLDSGAPPSYCASDVVLVGVTSRHGGYVDGIGILAEGTSQYTSNLSTGYHILINVMSTILPSSSNYCMQVLSAPTRADMDKAHEQGIYLDIQT